LISKLHAEYFPDELSHLDGVPGTVMTQNQQQSQSVLFQMILDVQSKIDEKISNYKDGSNEKSFLQKLKGSLSSISNVNQLIQTILKLAKDSGLDFNKALEIFT
jgi:ubiquinone biosynthesis protein Coq4